MRRGSGRVEAGQDGARRPRRAAFPSWLLSRRILHGDVLAELAATAPELLFAAARLALPRADTAPHIVVAWLRLRAPPTRTISPSQASSTRLHSVAERWITG